MHGRTSRRGLFLVALLLVASVLIASGRAESDECVPDEIAAGDVLVVRFASALQPGSADLVDLAVVGPVSDLCGLEVSDGEGNLTLGSIPVAVGDLVRLVSQPDLVVPADARVRHDIVWSADDLPVERSGRFALAKSGDHVALRHGAVAVDTVAYGDVDVGLDGWNGAGLEHSRIDRRIFQRGMDANGYVDRDGADEWTFPRIYRQHQDDRPTEWHEASGEVRAFVCPDQCHAEVALRIQEATRSIDVNLYDLSHREAVAALEAAADRGVAVRVLLHDRPVGASDEKMDRIAWSIDALRSSGIEVRVLQGLRFDVNHAKYLVVDGVWSIVLSENANGHGWPVAGAEGNRGWGTAVSDERVAAWLQVLFESDFLHAEDSRAVTGADLHPDAQSPRWRHAAPVSVDRLPSLVVPAGSGVRVLPVVAPDHLGDPGGSPLITALRGASSEVWTQQLNLPLEWRRPGYAQPSPLTQALGEVAARGVPVRGALAEAFEDGDPRTPGNDQTAAVLSDAERIDIRLGGAPTGGVVHNKGWLVDPVPGGRNLAVVGSANGNLASQALNREVVLFLEHPEIAAYYRAVLSEDRTRAAGLDEASGGDPFGPRGGAHELPAMSGAALAFLIVVVGLLGRCRSIDMSRLRRRAWDR